MKEYVRFRFLPCHAQGFPFILRKAKGRDAAQLLVPSRSAYYSNPDVCHFVSRPCVITFAALRRGDLQALCSKAGSTGACTRETRTLIIHFTMPPPFLFLCALSGWRSAADLNRPAVVCSHAAHPKCLPTRSAPGSCHGWLVYRVRSPGKRFFARLKWRYLSGHCPWLREADLNRC